MFDILKHALRRVFGIRMIEERLNTMQATLLSTEVRVAEMELHNAGMHAAMTNLMLRNEAMLAEIDRNLRDQACLLQPLEEDRPAVRLRARAKKAGLPPQ